MSSGMPSSRRLTSRHQKECLAARTWTPWVNATTPKAQLHKRVRMISPLDMADSWTHPRRPLHFGTGGRAVGTCHFC